MRAWWTVPLLMACAHPEAPPRPVRERAASMSLAAIPDAPVSGSLGGRPFALRTAWLRLVRRVGQERVDLVLSEGRPSRLCMRPTPGDARQVVLRFTGAARVPAGLTRIEPEERGREVFGEAQGAHGYPGTGGGSALLSVARVDDGHAEGRVRVCLPEPRGGCLAGTFSAVVCWDELDLDGPRGARDRPGDGGVR